MNRQIKRQHGKSKAVKIVSNQLAPKVPLFRIYNWHVYILSFRMHIKNILLLCVVLRFLYVVTESTIQNYQLANYGNMSKGIITSRIKVGSKGTIKIYYKFEINDRLFEGITSDEEYKEGDSISILYLKKNPSINKSYSFIKASYIINPNIR